MYKCADCGGTFEELLTVEDECGRLYACPECKGENLLTSKALFRPTPEQLFDRLIIPIARINEGLDSPLSSVDPAQLLADVFGFLAELIVNMCGDTGELEELLLAVKTDEDIKRCREEFLKQREGYVPI